MEEQESQYPNAESTMHANPFREMEKKYQLHLDQEMRYSRGKIRGKRGRFVERETDLSEVLDFQKAESATAIQSQTIHYVDCDEEKLVKVFQLEDHPGFYFLSSFLDGAAQVKLAHGVLNEYIEPPANSNHTKKYGHVPGLWEAAKEGLCFSLDEPGCWSTKDGGVSAKVLLNKLRWITLGPQFDWTRRCYNDDIKYRELPSVLKTMSEKIVHALDIDADYTADAALLNFYGSKDTLGGHKDDAEMDLSQPIVSMSIGCDAIFLLGHETKDIAPTAMLMRSGDVIVLSGQARTCYHGVPRILSTNALHPTGHHEERDLLEYLGAHRINVSIRQVRK